MKRLFFILLIFVIALTVNLPPQIKVGKRLLYRPSINWQILGHPFIRDFAVKLGLDLQGGTHLVYEAETSQIPPANRDSALESARLNIERRINAIGVSEPLIQTSKVGDKYRLIVELAGVSNIQDALALIGQTAQLDFRETKVATPSAQTDFIPTGLTGSDLQLAQVQFGSSSQSLPNQPSVGLEFSPEGTKKFADITARNVGKPLAIFLDNNLLTAPKVNTVISDGRASITGNYTVDEAKRLVIQLNAGALPVPIKIVEQRNIGATLGQESIMRSLVAGGIGLALVWLFMLAIYGKFGLVADIALGIYVLVSLSLVRLIPITLTLAGIAGLILSIGMAVDANILIFERIKEERRWGRAPQAAIELGFHRAWTSIRDSNASTLMTAAILFWFGSGSVRGFALTLAIGVVTSLFTAIVITKTLLRP